jgi:predicted TIM-barrel fold metal-dependent hydrolase
VTIASPNRSSIEGIDIIDVDTHLTEPHDLWTARAPRGYEDRVPSVKAIDGVDMWTIDGHVLGLAGASGVIHKDGSKELGSAFTSWGFDEAHPAMYQVGPRVEIMDQLGIWAQIVYPNAVGFGGQKFAEIEDITLRNLCATLYNDAMAEMQEESGGRIFPMALLPWWDIDTMVAEVTRIHALGLRGVNTNSDPQNQGLPDLGQPHWDPLWEACADLGLPINFHIGASATSHSWFGDAPWPSFDNDAKLALGSAVLYLSNARVLGNIIYSGILERYPTLKVVSVESGVGWIPFFLEALDYQITETAPRTMDHLSMKPSEYFRRQMYACFWFENEELVPSLEAVGYDQCMFETDFPHPTCLYPDSLTRVADALEGVDFEVRKKVLSGNAAHVYNLVTPGLAKTAR